jgi:hypothetical protein
VRDPEVQLPHTTTRTSTQQLCALVLERCTDYANLQYLFNELQSTVRTTGERHYNETILLRVESYRLNSTIKAMSKFRPLIQLLWNRAKQLNTFDHVWLLVEQLVEIQSWLFRAFVRGQQCGLEIRALESDWDEVEDYGEYDGPSLYFSEEIALGLNCSAGDVRKILKTLHGNGETLRRGGYEHSWFPNSIAALEQVLEWKEIDEAKKKLADDTHSGGDGAAGS